MKPGLIIDNFAGGGGASLGVEMACWKGPDIAINHDAIALGLHAVNHPHTEHHVEDVWNVDPRSVTKGRPVALAWFSPDCKHFSKAKGGKPVEKRIRGLAWVVIRWAVAVKPRLIVLENVEEFQDWGPLGADNMPCPVRKGQTFRLFVERLRQAGYEVDWRELKACDYGAPTIRKRLFLIARRDGLPIVWPEPTHAKPDSLEVGMGLRKPWRTAAECIDWSLPCPSIFGRERPLADKTMARIARGVQRYVIEAERPFIINLTHGGRVEDIDEPFKTLTGAHRGEKALVAPFFVPRHGEHATQEPRCRDVEQPMPTVTATANGAGLVAAFMAQHNGGMVGHSLEEPVSTLTAKCSHQNLITVGLDEGSDERRDRERASVGWCGDIGGSSERRDLAPEEGQEQRRVCPDRETDQSGMPFKGGLSRCRDLEGGQAVSGSGAPACLDGSQGSDSERHRYQPSGWEQSEQQSGEPRDCNEGSKSSSCLQNGPTKTFSVGADANRSKTEGDGKGPKGNGTQLRGDCQRTRHFSNERLSRGEFVAAFLQKYYGTGGQHQTLDEPMHTATAKARLGLVTVAGVDYQIIDIGMRMLASRELFRAQGFPDDYIIDRLADGTAVSKTDQIRLCGNSVCPPLARAIVAANFGNEVVREGGRVAA